MDQIRATRSELIVRNVVEKTILVLGVRVRPGARVDIFRDHPTTTEWAVVEALKEGGSLNAEIKLGNIRLEKLSLFTTSNIEVETDHIHTKNDSFDGAILSVDADGILTWMSPTEHSVSAAYPLYNKAGAISVDRASETTSGYLAAEDFALFKQKHQSIRIWQYQDFISYGGNVVHLTAFESGSMLFNEERIISGSAVIIDEATGKPPTFKTGWFSRKDVIATQHSGATVVLNHQPIGKFRVYFLVVLDNRSDVDNFVAPPRAVINARIALLDMLDFNMAGPQTIVGHKDFIGNIKAPVVEAHRIVVDEIAAGSLSMSGGTEGFVMTSGSLGDVHWTSIPAVGMAPTNTYPGLLWVYDEELYIRSVDNDRWLSVSSFSKTFFIDELVMSDRYFDTLEKGRKVADVFIYGDTWLGAVEIMSESRGTYTIALLVDGREISSCAVSGGRLTWKPEVVIEKDTRVSFYVKGRDILNLTVECVFKKSI